MLWKAMHGLKREALTMKECLLKGDFTGLVDSMRQGWESKNARLKRFQIPTLKKFTTRQFQPEHWQGRFPVLAVAVL